MKRIFRVFFVIIIATISFKCQKELSSDHVLPATPIDRPSPITVTLQGNVLDENDQPAAGVKISAGSKTVVTDAHGYFRIANVLLDKNASVATAEQAGYFKAYRSFRATTGVNQLVIKLVKKILAGVVNASSGGEVVLANGAKVSLPANGVTKLQGGAYAGNMQVYAAYIDPTSNDIVKTVPGSFMADDKDKNRVVLSSYGMIAVELESSAGEKLQIQTGSAATLTMPVPTALLSSAPATISLWYVDEQTGIWKEQGTAQKTGSAYKGEVKHFSYWNCDVSLPAVGFSAILKTSNGTLLINTNVSVRTLDINTGTAHGYTDSLGQVAGLIPANTPLVLEVFDDCYNVVYSKNIGPFTATTDLGTIIVPGSLSSLITVKGRLMSCNNTPVVDGFAILYWNNFVSYLNTDAEGKFSTTMVACTGTPPTCEILAIDRSTQQQGTVLSVPLNGQVADAGDVAACGTSVSQFINYTLDGTDYTIIDSLAAYSYGNPGSSPTTHIWGFKINSNEGLSFSFTGKEAVGVYPLDYLSMSASDSMALTKPFNITITAYPQNPGGFYEGNFSGSFVYSSTPLIIHKIKCSFRVRRY